MTTTAKKQRLTILGATGSIGLSTLDVVARHPERFEVLALTAHTRMAALAQLCIAHRPRYAVAANDKDASTLTGELRTAGLATEVLAGPRGLEQVAALSEVDTVMAAIVGSAGLAPTLAAVRAGKRVLLANKEALVMAGALFMAEVRQAGATLLPIDSEHNAVFQSLPADYAGSFEAKGVRRIMLTASGGPFRTAPLEQMAGVTPEQACAHPNWVMGRKISVDSATMMNKGLEVIEAHWLFNAPVERIEVVIHPQSIIHSLV
ncbi:MAG: 1-deoxy-D-xylulose-5-phosphate reductoisomerase, partial [Pseudomonadota bacterium]